MKIIVNNKEAVITKNTSFEYTSENSLFTGADGYTFNISFPLRDCQQNIEIFGNLKRQDINLKNIIYDCEIHDAHILLRGVLAITEVSEKEVKTQFLKGKSVENYYTDLDEIYINEMNISDETVTNHFAPSNYWREISDNLSGGYIVIPWINNTSGNIQNAVYLNSLREWEWAGEQDESVSPMYYLLWIAKRIATLLQMSFDFSPWEQSNYKNLIVCNTFPAAWNVTQIAQALPHWSVTQFFSELEKLLNCEFDIDRARKTIKMKSNVAEINNQETFVIDYIIDEFTAEVEEDSEEKYVENTNYKYAEADHNMQKYYSCSYVIEQMVKLGKVFNWNTIDAFLRAMAEYENVDTSVIKEDDTVNYIHYVKDVDTYFALKVYKATYDSTGKPVKIFFSVVPINTFGERKNNDSDSYKEINIVPVCLDEVTNSVLPFLECGTYGETESETENEIPQPMAENLILQGESNSNKEFYNKIYVAFWNNTTRQGANYPHPVVDKFEIDKTLTKYNFDFSLRLTSNIKNTEWSTKHRIEQNKKYNFTFISMDIPNVKDIFLIKGQRYLAEKISTTFTEKGMSSVMKGTFYRIYNDPS